MSKSNIRGRAWAGIAYPESVNPDWINMLDMTHLDIIISPLHDKDKNPTGEVKKPHWHILIMWNNPTTWSNANRLFESIGAVMDPAKVESSTGYARYLLHLDNPEKHQYERKELTIMGAVDYEELIQKSQNNKRTLRQFFRWLTENRITSYAYLIKRLDEEGLDDYYHIATTTHTLATNTMLKSLDWENKKIMGDVPSYEFEKFTVKEIIDYNTGEVFTAKNEENGMIF